MTVPTYGLDDDDDTLGSAVTPPPPNGQQEVRKTSAEWAAERREKKADRDAILKAEALARENAFLRAGIDPAGDEPTLVTYFVQGYKGELTAEAIKAEATRLGIYEAAGAGQAQQQVVLEQNGQTLDAVDRVANLGQSADAAPDQGVMQAKALQDAYKAGGVEGMADTLQAMGIPRATL